MKFCLVKVRPSANRIVDNRPHQLHKRRDKRQQLAARLRVPLPNRGAQTAASHRRQELRAAQRPRRLRDQHERAANHRAHHRERLLADATVRDRLALVRHRLSTKSHSRRRELLQDEL